jgi:hypothetical protein
MYYQNQNSPVKLRRTQEIIDLAGHIAKALHGTRNGNGWLCRCPLPGHGRGRGDRNPSLSIAAGTKRELILRCHGGCDSRDVLRYLLNHRLLEPGAAEKTTPPPNTNEDDRKKFEAAMKIWRESLPPTGTGAERYLNGRRLDVVIPPTLRFCPRLKHPSGGFWPAMIALVTNADDEPIAVHRTFLEPDTWVKAPVNPRKMMLGRCGGGAVRLRTIGPRLYVSEGIETALSAIHADGRPVWAALSAGGIENLVLPASIREIVILADADPAGERAAQNARQRWIAERRRVGILRPSHGSDFNDVLREAC